MAAKKIPHLFLVYLPVKDNGRLPFVGRQKHNLRIFAKFAKRCNFFRRQVVSLPLWELRKDAHRYKPHSIPDARI